MYFLIYYQYFVFFFKLCELPAKGAMENWGLTNYKEEILLIDTSFNAATARDLQRVAIVSAHEMTHQWKAPKALLF